MMPKGASKEGKSPEKFKEYFFCADWSKPEVSYL